MKSDSQNAKYCKNRRKSYPAWNTRRHGDQNAQNRRGLANADPPAPPLKFVCLQLESPQILEGEAGGRPNIKRSETRLDLDRGGQAEKLNRVEYAVKSPTNAILSLFICPAVLEDFWVCIRFQLKSPIGIRDQFTIFWSKKTHFN